MIHSRINLVGLYGTISISNERVKLLIFKEGDYVRFNLGVRTIDRIGILDDVDPHSSKPELIKAVIMWLNDNSTDYKAIEDRDLLLKYLYENHTLWN